MNAIFYDIGQLAVVVVFFLGLMYLMRKLWPQWTGGKTPRGRNLSEIIKALKTIKQGYKGKKEIVSKLDWCIAETRRLQKSTATFTAFTGMWNSLKGSLLDDANLSKIPEDFRAVVPAMVKSIDNYLGMINA
jgi:hypothetical protein